MKVSHAKIFNSFPALIRYTFTEILTMPEAKEYESINICLYELGFILKSIGVTEFSISQDKRSVVWDTKKEIDKKLLNKLCTAVRAIYKTTE